MDEVIASLASGDDAAEDNDEPRLSPRFRRRGPLNRTDVAGHRGQRRSRRGRGQKSQGSELELTQDGTKEEAGDGNDRSGGNGRSGGKGRGGKGCRGLGAEPLSSFANRSECSLLFSRDAAPCPQRSPPSPARRRSSCRPDYFILGTRKGGTTSLHHYLAAHPAVYPYKLDGGPQDGENFHELGSMKHAHEYRGASNTSLLVGDASVARLVNDAEELRKFCVARGPCGKPGLPFGFRDAGPRLMVLLREPVARCASQMRMRARLGSMGLSAASDLSAAIEPEVRSFEAFAKGKPADMRVARAALPGRTMESSHNCLYEGAYAIHLALLLRRVPRHLLRVYWSDDLFSPAVVPRLLEDALRFLGLDPNAVDAKAVVRIVHNGGDGRGIGAAARATASSSLSDVFSPVLVRRMDSALQPFNAALSKLLGAPLPLAWTAERSRG